MTRLSVVLVGYGTGGAVFHAPLITSHPQLRLAGVVTSNTGRAAAARAAYPQTQVFSSLASAAAGLGGVDLVVVATPHTSHVSATLEAIDAGASVLVDKPVATSLGHARRFRTALRNRRAVHRVSVFQNRRLDGDFLTVRRLIEDGMIGTPHRFESRFERWRPTPRPGSWRETASAANGGGVLLDLGVHLVDQAVVLFGPAQSVYAQLHNRRANVSNGDDLFVAITHANAVVSHLSATASAAAPGPRIRLLGSKAAYVKGASDIQEEQLRSGLTPASAEWGIEPCDRYGVLTSSSGERTVPTASGEWHRHYALIVDAINAGAPLPVPIDDVIATMTALEMARLSAAEDTIVDLTFPALVEAGS